MEYVKSALSGSAADDGLIQRFQLAVWPDALGEWKNIDRWPNTTARERANDIYERLDTLAAETVGAHQGPHDVTPAIRFCEDAQRLFNEWRAELEKTLRANNMENTPALESHLAKYRSLMPSLALVFHLVDVVEGKVEGPVSREAALLSWKWCDYLHTHARKIYAEEIQGELIGAHALLHKIKHNDVFDGDTLRDIVRNGWADLNTTEKVEAAASALEKLNWLKIVTEKPEGKRGGRPKIFLRLNPKVQK
jgi:hypothetical protein